MFGVGQGLYYLRDEKCYLLSGAFQIVVDVIMKLDDKLLKEGLFVLQMCTG